MAKFQNTYRLEAYLHKPEGGGLIINPKPSTIPKIGKVELHYVDDKKSDSFSFYDRLRAKAHTTGMLRKELIFILWEDDTKGGGHSVGNQPIEVKSARVQHNGLAVVEFTLTKGLMQKAMKGEADAKEFEFYVTVEYYKGKTHDSENVNVHNPLYKALEKKKSHPKAHGSPAEQKPPSKREEKNILIHQAHGYLHDWAEVKGKAQKDKEIKVNRNNGKSTVGVESQPMRKQDDKCLCQQYDLVWGDKVSCEFRKKVVEICAELWGESKIEMANGLMAVMNVETGGSFKAHQIMGSKLKDVNSIVKDDFWLLTKNKKGKIISKGSRAVGLIQFTQDALQQIDEFTEHSGFDKLHEVKLRFAKMGEIKQLDYVKKYFEKLKEKIKSAEDIYLHVFAPKGVGKDNDYVLYDKSKDGIKYKQNASVDKENNNDGKIQRSEILGRYRISYTEGLANKSKNFTCSEIISKSIIDNHDKIKWHDPVDNPMLCLYTQNGNYRPRYNVFGKVRKEREKHNHQGIDLLALPGSNAYACVDSTVEYIDVQGGYGNVICLKVKNPKEFLKRKRDFKLQYEDEGEILSGTGFNFNGDFYLFYAHLKEINKSLAKGDFVNCGTIIGQNGTSGYGSTKDPHLHFEIRSSTSGSGLNNRCHPGYFVYYKDENTMTQKEKEYHKEIATKNWD